MQELFTTHFLEVLKNKYAEFTGRETRRNYWMYVRITSYNVCYTKLLRKDIFIQYPDIFLR